jgi:hypothetical protein
VALLDPRNHPAEIVAETETGRLSRRPEALIPMRLP